MPRGQRRNCHDCGRIIEYADEMPIVYGKGKKLKLCGHCRLKIYEKLKDEFE